MEAFGQHLGNRGEAQPVELGLVAVIRRHRGNERPGRILRRDRIGREGVAAGFGQRLLDGLGVGRMQVLAGDVAIGGERLVDIGAEMAVDDAGRCTLAIEQHLQAGDFLAADKDHARLLGPLARRRRNLAWLPCDSVAVEGLALDRLARHDARLRLFGIGARRIGIGLLRRIGNGLVAAFPDIPRRAGPGNKAAGDRECLHPDRRAGTRPGRGSIRAAAAAGGSRGSGVAAECRALRR